jgi:RNA polymerase sigma-70 factor, ECF subfamily
MRTDVRQAEVAQLLMQHRAALYAFIFSCVRNHADAEDVLQSTTLAVMVSADQLPSLRAFLPWARDIARRRVLAHLRGTQREQACDPALVQALAEAAARLDVTEPAPTRQAALRQCLDRLPPKSRRLITMRYDPESGDAADIAARFGHSVQSVYARIKRIKAALRACVERRLARKSEE